MRQDLVVTMQEEHWRQQENLPPEDEENDACLECVCCLSGQWAWIWPGEVLRQVRH